MDWYLSPDGYAVRYARANDGRKSPVYMHRLVTRAPTNRMTDHENGDRLDNRRTNLRLATASQNNANSKDRPRRSRFRGVYWHNPSNKWVAQVSVGGQPRHLGLFANEVKAARAYDRAAYERFGEYASLNFPKPLKRLA